MLVPTRTIRWRRASSVSMEEFGRETVIAHNDPSPARERVLRLYERRHAPINIRVALPSLDGIKRAVEMGWVSALLPRRCALAEIARGQLVAVRSPSSALNGRCGWCTGAPGSCHTRRTLSRDGAPARAGGGKEYREAR